MNRILKLALAGAVMPLVVSCGSGDAAQARQDSAADMQKQIQASLEQHDYDKAIALIDSFAVVFPEQTDIRAELVKTHRQAVRDNAAVQLPLLQQQIDVLTASIDGLERSLTTVQPVKSLPPYLAESATMAAPGIQARVNTGDDGRDVPWTIAVDAGQDIGLQSLTVVTDAGQTYMMALDSDDGRLASVMPESASSLGQAVACGETAVSATLGGSRRNVTVKLTPGQSQALGTAWTIARDRKQLFETRKQAETYARVLANY